jgi:CBS domain-containing protein
MQVREIMSSPAITVGPDAGIRSVARVMLENQISGVPVVDDEGALLGAITELDLIARNAPVQEPHYLAVLSAVIPLNPREVSEYREQLRQALAVNAGELMTDDVPIVSPDVDIEEALELMLDPEVVMLPVIEDEKVVGVVTRTDLVQLIERLESAPDEEGA